MADNPEKNVQPRKPRVPRRKDLAESYKSLEAATADRHRRKPESAESSASNTVVTSDPLGDSLFSQSTLSMTSPLQPTTSSQIPLSSDFSPASDLQGSSSSWSLLRSPDAVGINGLSAGVAEAPTQPNLAGGPVPRIELGDTSQKLRGATNDRDSADIPDLYGSSSATTTATATARGSHLEMRMTPELGAETDQGSISDAASPHSGEISHKIIEVKDLAREVECDAAAVARPRLLLQFTALTYTVSKKSSRWSRCRPKAARPPPVGGRGASSTSSTPPGGGGGQPTSLRLLDDISGEARDGEILAVMGPSGSGKSTLIDALAQRIDSVQGRMTLNGEAVTDRLLRTISAYVMQDDLLFPMLTVKETLMFSAFFRLPLSQSKAAKHARVLNLLDQLGLMRVANTIIGDEGRRGVSGGERRRVSIGIDIIHDPLLLFLDEPTSGLDSTSAYMVVRTLQKIAQTGSIVILSIHQPSYRILGLLDRLILLAYGQKIYGGSPADLHVFFESFGRPVPKYENSTEYALDLIQELHASHGGVKQMVDFYKTWGPNMDVHAAATDDFAGIHFADTCYSSEGKLVPPRSSTCDSSMEFLASHRKSCAEMVGTFANPWWAEITVLIRRSLKNIRRTRELFFMRLATVMVTGFLLATIFWHLDHSPKGVQERLGFFAFAMSTTYYTCADALPVFLQERYIFMRETTHNAYRISSYVLAHAIIYVPFLAILSMAFAVTIWWAVGLAGGGTGFFFFFLIIWASFWAGNSFVTLLSAIMPNVMLGYTIVVALLAYFLLLSGFFISRVRIPKYWLWFHYLSIIKYPYEAVLINEFEKTGTCYENGRQILYGTPMATLNESIVDNMLLYIRSLPALRNTIFAELNPASCILTGHDVLVAKEITQLSKWACLGITVGFGVFFRTLFYVVLKTIGKNTRK